MPSVEEFYSGIGAFYTRAADESTRQQFVAAQGPSFMAPAASLPGQPYTPPPAAPATPQPTTLRGRAIESGAIAGDPASAAYREIVEPPRGNMFIPQAAIDVPRNAALDALGAVSPWLANTPYFGPVMRAFELGVPQTLVAESPIADIPGARPYTEALRDYKPTPEEQARLAGEVLLPRSEEEVGLELIPGIGTVPDVARGARAATRGARTALETSELAARARAATEGVVQTPVGPVARGEFGGGRPTPGGMERDAARARRQKNAIGQGGVETRAGGAEAPLQEIRFAAPASTPEMDFVGEGLSFNPRELNLPDLERLRGMSPKAGRGQAAAQGKLDAQLKAHEILETTDFEGKVNAAAVWDAMRHEVAMAPGGKDPRDRAYLRTLTDIFNRMSRFEEESDNFLNTDILEDAATKAARLRPSQAPSSAAAAPEIAAAAPTPPRPRDEFSPEVTGRTPDVIAQELRYQQREMGRLQGSTDRRAGALRRQVQQQIDNLNEEMSMAQGYGQPDELTQQLEATQRMLQERGGRGPMPARGPLVAGEVVPSQPPRTTEAPAPGIAPPAATGAGAPPPRPPTATAGAGGMPPEEPPPPGLGRPREEVPTTAGAESPVLLDAPPSRDEIIGKATSQVQNVARATGKSPEEVQQATSFVDYFLRGNEEILNATKDAEGWREVMQGARAVLTGDLADEYLTALLHREHTLRQGLVEAGLTPDEATDAAKAIRELEMRKRYPRGVPSRVTKELETIKGAAYNESLGGVETALQRLKNTRFGLDLGIFGVQLLASARRGIVPITAAHVNRLLAALRLPHVQTHIADVALDKKLRNLADGVGRGTRGQAYEEDVGTIFSALGPLGRKVDRQALLPVLNKLNSVQFNNVMGWAGDAAYEGNLVMLHLMGRDITNPRVRAAAADSANAIRSFAQQALRSGRRTGERIVFTSPAMTRSQVANIRQMAKLLDGTAEERALAATAILSQSIFYLVVGKYLNDELGITDFEVDPSKPGFGNITLPWKDANGRNRVINLFPQQSIDRAIARSMRVISEGNPEDLQEIWLRYMSGRATDPTRIALGVAAQAGYGERGFTQDLTLEELGKSLLPLPPTIMSHVQATGSTAPDLLSTGAEFFGLSEFGERASITRSRLLEDEIIPQLIAEGELPERLRGKGVDEMGSGEYDILMERVRQQDPKLQELYETERREAGDPWQLAADQAKAYDEKEISPQADKLWADLQAGVITPAKFKQDLDRLKAMRSATRNNIYNTPELQKRRAEFDSNSMRLLEDQWFKIPEESQVGSQVDWDKVEVKRDQFLLDLYRRDPQLAEDFTKNMDARETIEEVHEAFQLSSKAQAARAEYRATVETKVIPKLIDDGTLSRSTRGLKYDDLGSGELDQIRKVMQRDYASVTKNYEDLRRFSDNIFQTTSDDAKKYDAETVMPALDEQLAALMNGQDPNELRDEKDAIMDERVGAMQLLYNRSEYKNATKDLPQNSMRALEDMWFKIPEQSKVRGKVDWDQVEANRASFLAGLRRQNPALAERFERNINARDSTADMHPLLQMYAEVNEAASEYFDIPDEPEFDVEREAWLQQHPTENAALWLTYGTAPKTVNALLQAERYGVKGRENGLRISDTRQQVTPSTVKTFRDHAKEIDYLTQLRGETPDGRMSLREAARRSSIYWDALYTWLGMGQIDKEKDNSVVVYHDPNEVIEFIRQTFGSNPPKGENIRQSAGSVPFYRGPSVPSHAPRLGGRVPTFG